ncbi:MAG: diacylglycerol kinase family protein [Chloroflexi bacterium]|nr:diacylglycerol kinase family protein [Chloroflexota bacterium]
MNPPRDRTTSRRALPLWASFGYAVRGIYAVAWSQRNFRIHVVAATLVCAVAWWLECSRLEWAILLITMGFVLVSEALNTAVETVVDLVSPEYHVLAARAKDVAAGAVLIAALTAVGVAVVILLPLMYERIQP